jgi:very-short-patch-repair endonuclease
MLERSLHLDERDDQAEEGHRRRPAKSGRLQKSRSGRHRLTQAARSFRNVPTGSENLLWQQLRRGRLHGHTFRRQHPIGPYIADFCCPVQSFIVEIDGPIHAEQRDADAERQCQLEASGYRILRVTAHDVETRMSAVLQAISDSLDPL